MDEHQFEQAERLTERARDDALERARRATQHESHPGFDGVSCVDCEDRLPALRLQMGRVRCVPCQERRERAR